MFEDPTQHVHIIPKMCFNLLCILIVRFWAQIFKLIFNPQNYCPGIYCSASVIINCQVTICLLYRSELYFVKLPNFLSVETRPFDPALYEDEADEDHVQDEEGHARMKLKVMSCDGDVM